MEAQLVPGYRLDRYELLCPIASGGMASVWLARLRGKRGFEKLFAIKTIKTELISDPSFQDMFLDEARIASRIIHPNVAQILELGEQDDVLYIVMEYVDGDSLAKVGRLAIRAGSPLPPGVALRIVADACAGLHAAHQLKDAQGESLGVVHRDVSPQNVLVTTAGTVKVIDFGLVKAKNRGAPETKTGVVKGKIRYMAPEQVHATGTLDHRADVWAAGMCLYELVTGHAPYHTEEEFDVVKRLMSATPLPSFDVALPAPIEGILSRALVKDPNGRFESCAAMRRAIDAAIHQLELAAETEDVADFLRHTLPDLATKRAATIAKAIEAAETRNPQVPSLEGLGPGDMAFAATEVSGRDGLASSDAMPLTKRLPKGSGGPSGTSSDSDGGRNLSNESASEAGRSTSVTSLTQQLEERRRRSSAGYWLATLAVVGAGTVILWPRLTTPAPSVEPPAASAELADASDAPSPSASVVTSASALPEPEPSAVPPVPKKPELDPWEAVVLAPDAAAPGPRAGTTARPSGPRASTTPSAAPPAWDGGLSPGAASAAKIMLAPRASESPAPSPPASTDRP